MSVVASYVNTESPGVSGVAFSGYSHAKQGMSLESPSPEGVSDAQVDQMNPSYGFIVAGKRGEAQPPPPVPSKAAHYQAPKSNMPVYERMDSVTRFEVPSLQSPCDPSAPLVDSPVEADNDASFRRETRNPVYSQQDGGIDRKRVFSGETEDEVVTYNKSRRKCCSVKAALLSTLLIILFFMSAASLMLNLLMLFGGLDLTGKQSTVTHDQIQALRNELSSSLQDLNTSFTQLVVNLNVVGPQGPMGYNGSAGPQGPQGEAGPEAVGGVVNLSNYCKTKRLECDLVGGSCDTNGLVSEEAILAHWCSLEQTSFFGNVIVKTASLVTLATPSNAHQCHCEATLSAGATGKCVYTRVSCNMDNVNVVLNYPKTRNSTGTN